MGLPEDVYVTQERTWIPLGVALSLVVAAVLGAAWINGQFASINSTMSANQASTGFRLTTISGRLATIEERLDESVATQALRGEIRSWILIYRAKNPSADIPDFP